MRSGRASRHEGRDLRTDTETLSSSLYPMVSGGGSCGCCRWHCCQTAAWQLAYLMWKESASFVGGRISGIDYGLCDSWLTGPCWQYLTLAHCILQMKSSASQRDHLFSVITADPSTAEKHSSKIPCQGVESHPEITPSADMKSSPEFLKLSPFCEFHNGVSGDMLSFNPDFWSFHFVKMYQQYHSTICVLWNNKIAGCLVIYWRNTVSASSWEASKWLVSCVGRLNLSGIAETTTS